MSSRWPAHTGHRPASASSGQTRSLPACRNRRGSGSPPELARKVIATTTGPSSPLPHAADQHQGNHWLLIRRNRTTGELAFYRCWSQQLVPLHHLVAVAGSRWRIEESFQATKTGLGLDQHQHRRWKAWHRWTTLVIAAHAFLAAATLVSTASPDDLIAITVNELRRLFHALVTEPARRLADVIAWSIYRRRHQATAKTCHYARQALTEP